MQKREEGSNRKDEKGFLITLKYREYIAACSVVPNHANGYLNQNQNHTFKNDLKSNQNHIL